jgi:hypothetical protein
LAGSTFATAGTGSPRRIPSFHRVTGASFGTGGHGLPAAFCCFRNTAIGARTFLTAGM